MFARVIGGFNMRKIRKIVVHCTDSDDSLDIGVREVNKWHEKRGWLSPLGTSCGYHYIIRRSGIIERGRLDEEVGAHVAGHNTDSIGVCWVGRKAPAKKQMKSLRQLVKALMLEHQVDIEYVLGHYEFNGVTKTCPNIDMIQFRAEVVFTKAAR